MRHKLFAVLVCTLALSGCGTVRDTLGLGGNNSGPDEFGVATTPPLAIPPDYTLRPPVPGMARPQEVTASTRAEQLLTGTTAGTTKAASGGEGALLEQADAGRPAPTPADPALARSITADGSVLETALFGTPTATTNAPKIDVSSGSSWF